MNHLLLIRGLPGSGKSTLAKKFLELGYMHFETDMYFYGLEGVYIFQPEKLSIAHKWCLDAVKRNIKTNNIVVSNTFSRIWELQPYLDIEGCTKTIITCEGNYGNIHNVPEETVLKMKQRWERLDQ